MNRYLVYVDGRVQGVGFRFFACQHARARHLTGSVKNLENGLVEIYIQGEEEQINSFLSAIQQGNRFIRVDQISVKKIPIVEKEREFIYLY
ncbi:MAG: acylphosphatase [Solobacterium sp.]|nr:acylphosphatase [Solobacterium sp.]